MKLSFSTFGWHDYTWQDFCEVAKDGGFAVVGVYDKQSEKFAAQMQKECDAYVRSLVELIE